LKKEFEIKLSPSLKIDKKIHYYNQDSDVQDYKVCLVQEKKKNSGKVIKTGDITLQKCLTSTDMNEHTLILEVKNSKTSFYLKNGLATFYKNSKNHKNAKNNSFTFYVYISMCDFEIEINMSNEGKKKRMVIKDLKKDDFYIDVIALSKPDSEMSFEIIKASYNNITYEEETKKIEKVKPKSIVILKYSQEKGGYKIPFPSSISTLLVEGGKKLGIEAIKVRDYKFHAEISEIETIDSDEAVYLTTKEDEKKFK